MPGHEMTEGDIRQFKKDFDALLNGLREHLIGQREAVWFVVATFLSQGHILLEGNPGTAKTFLAQLLGQLTGLEMSRVQGTPDLMPGDIIGSPMIQPGAGEWQWRDGPIFGGNLIFVDEINRMNPRTQSVTLQAMQEGSVQTLDRQAGGSGEKFLKRPHMFIATMNPIEQEGVYPLPEAQLDRFTAKLILPAPTEDDLLKIMDRYADRHTTRAALADIGPCGRWPKEGDRTERGKQALEILTEMRDVINAVEMGALDRDIAAIVRATTPLMADEKVAKDSPRRNVQYGGSPRGAQALLQLARVHALTEERAAISRSDIEFVLPPTMRHRIQLKYEFVVEGGASEAATVEQFLQKLKDSV
uniref:MoxR-like ATPase n=1 Tax=Candidatus Kentrum sp. DK TaxID=2126562 RepID=A0A450T4U3_9GAMM|nr:MAG: MoxR-like ATPase [Candidatus Kentron sp. DK]